MPIPDQHVEAALDYLRDRNNEAAEARAQAEHLEHMRHVMLARITSKQDGKSHAERETAARATEEYEKFLEGLKAASFSDHMHRNKRAAAIALIDAWRTQQSNMRSVSL